MARYNANAILQVGLAVVCTVATGCQLPVADAPSRKNQVRIARGEQDARQDSSSPAVSTEALANNLKHPQVEQLPADQDGVYPPVRRKADTEGTPIVRVSCSQVDPGNAAEADSIIRTASEQRVDEFERYPIDLPTTLRLAGAENWTVRLAWERIHEAQSREDAAEAMWLPSLNVGLGWTKHEGKLQAANGQIVDVSRNSLFVGGGAVTSDAPIAGGAGGPARMAVDLSLADAIFEPLAARQAVNAARAEHCVTFNNTLLEASLAYYGLLSAQGRLAVARENVRDAEDLLELTKTFVAASQAARSEITRMQVELSKRLRKVVEADLEIKLASTELARILQLDASRLAPGTILYSVDDRARALEFVSESGSLDALIVQGQGIRPEIAEEYASMCEAWHRVRQETWRPWIPNLHLGVSSGVFGGGSGASNSGLDGRADVDALVVWQMRNLGYGEYAARRHRRSQYRQAVLHSHQVRDLIAAEVTVAWYQVHAYRESMELTRRNVEQAVEVYDKNRLRISAAQGLPLEALQSLQAVADARNAHLSAIVDYNKAQLLLLRSIGQPLSR